MTENISSQSMEIDLHLRGRKMTELIFSSSYIYRIRCTVRSLKGNEIQRCDWLEIVQSKPIRPSSTTPSFQQNYMLINRLEINFLDDLLYYPSDQGGGLESCHEDQIHISHMRAGRVSGFLHRNIQ